jgi:2,3-bisphosphoglycerate-dependent phosphoglycerate mutase
MRLFLIRHGQSVTNVSWDDIVESQQMNAHLTDLGHDQSRKLAEWLHGKVPHLEAIYTSSLHRALETAVPLEQIYGCRAIVDHRLREGGYCYTNGEPIEDDCLPMHKRANFHEAPYRPLSFELDGVESYNDLRTRSGQFLAQILEDHRNGTVAVITHGWTLNAILDNVFNIGQYRTVYVNAENTSVTYMEHLDQIGYEPWRVHFIAQTPHLEVFPNGLDVTLNPEA